MITANHLYKHTKLNYTCTVSTCRGGWVEFYIDPDSGLRWLEESIFAQVHTLVGPSESNEKSQLTIASLRAQASARGIMIPPEILS